ncbi:MAG: 2Fe-2S iron-sulfur cluster binding domain-containing protein [Gammaproteobacteria bacterium]|nr:2Fe-2S iron-sulfur cluster binding domain-containing protein [Gammaproteobacteria bacterium]MBI5618047.1 2Fe-2S iron-sulfur cluster binding domain-containing protein [Gammaproteobacteria bacterium]
MGVIHALDRDGVEHALPAREGLSLMEILRNAGLPVEATCGGQCICSTCHVYIDPHWADGLTPRTPTEQVLVEDTGHFRETSRLACQIEFSPELDGLKLELAPEY